MQNLVYESTISNIPWFDVQVEVHQGSILSPLLFIIVMEALSGHLQTGCPWEILYVDDLVIIAETLGELFQKFRVKPT